MEKKYKIAVVKLLEDYGAKEYGFALYDNDVCVGDLVVVNPRNNLTLGRVHAVMTCEEYGKAVTKEVVAKVNEIPYLERVEARKKYAEREKLREQLIEELDRKIAGLKVASYYEKVVKEFADMCPELVVLYDQIKALSD